MHLLTWVGFGLVGYVCVSVNAKTMEFSLFTKLL
jgi:hypothetical protein